MERKYLIARAAAGICNIKNPIRLAKSILYDPEFVFLIGKEAEDYAEKRKLDRVSGEYFKTKFREEQWLAAKCEG